MCKLVRDLFFAISVDKNFAVEAHCCLVEEDDDEDDEEKEREEGEMGDKAIFAFENVQLKKSNFLRLVLLLTRAFCNSVVSILKLFSSRLSNAGN